MVVRVRNIHNHSHRIYTWMWMRYGKQLNIIIRAIKTVCIGMHRNWKTRSRKWEEIWTTWFGMYMMFIQWPNSKDLKKSKKGHGHWNFVYVCGEWDRPTHNKRCTFAISKSLSRFAQWWTSSPSFFVNPSNFIWAPIKTTAPFQNVYIYIPGKLIEFEATTWFGSMHNQNDAVKSYAELGTWWIHHCRERWIWIIWMWLRWLGDSYTCIVSECDLYVWHNIHFTFE